MINGFIWLLLLRGMAGVRAFMMMRAIIAQLREVDAMITLLTEALANGTLVPPSVQGPHGPTEAKLTAAPRKRRNDGPPCRMAGLFRPPPETPLEVLPGPRIGKPAGRARLGWRGTMRGNRANPLRWQAARQALGGRKRKLRAVMVPYKHVLIVTIS